MARKIPPSPQQDELIALLRTQAQPWLDWPNVTSVGVGPKLVNGQPTGELSIQVSVAEKIGDAKKIAARGLRVLPKSLKLPDGRVVPVDVVERSFRLSHDIVALPPPVQTGEAAWPAALRRRRRVARLVPGVSVSHRQTPSGTLGAIVYEQTFGRPCLLGNAHILAGGTGQVGDIVVQPGSSDSADLAGNGAARLLRSHVGLAGDCAIASIDGRLFDEGILGLGIAPRRVAKAVLGDRVVKSGRTTGVTYGVVTRVGLVFRHDYGGSIGKQDIGAFEIGADPARPPGPGGLCDGGDSGALWLIADGGGAATDIGVGLHFARQVDDATGAEHALACNLHSVFDRLGVSFQPPA